MGRKHPFGFNVGSSPKPKICFMISPQSTTNQLKPLLFQWSNKECFYLLQSVFTFFIQRNRLSEYPWSLCPLFGLAWAKTTFFILFMIHSYKDIRLTRMFWLYPKNGASWSKNRSREGKEWGSGNADVSKISGFFCCELICERMFLLWCQQQVCIPIWVHAHVCMHTPMCVCFCVGESGDLVERGQMLKMVSHHVLARNTWLELAKLLGDQP